MIVILLVVVAAAADLIYINPSNKVIASLHGQITSQHKHTMLP